MRTLYILHGFFGSGKSTWARNFSKEHPDTKIVSADSFRTMLNGEYEYVVELDNVINLRMKNTIYNLFANGYSVIVDVGNLSKSRRSDWMRIQTDKRIAVVFPQKDKQWHIKNSSAKPHTANWDYIWDAEHKSYEPINEKDFDEIIKVKEW